MYHELYKTIQKSLCSIVVYLGNEVISEGSGFSINEDGAVFTAAHVVTGRLPIVERDYKDPDARILVKFPGHDAVEYLVAVCGIHISDSAFTETLQIDQALLVPRTPLTFNIPPFAIGSAPKLGEEIFFAGYSDELEMPLRLDRLLRSDAKDVQLGAGVRKGNSSDMTGPIIKRGVIGNTLTIETIEVATDLKITCSIFYIDNGIHSGASGGPVVNLKGEAVGVIVQRAITSASQATDTALKVPSGSTVGISCLDTISSMVRRLTKT